MAAAREGGTSSITPRDKIDAFHFLAALAVTLLVFGFLTGLLWLSCRHRQRRIHSRRGTPRQGSFTSRLVCSGIVSLVVLILQQTLWGSSILRDDDYYEEEYPNYDLWIVFLYCNGVAVALLGIAGMHCLCSKHSSSDGSGEEDELEWDQPDALSPCDDTVATNESDSYLFDEESGRNEGLEVGCCNEGTAMSENGVSRTFMDKTTPPLDKDDLPQSTDTDK